MKKNNLFTIRRILVTIFLIIFMLFTYINFRGSYLEYKELGENYLQTFLTKQKYQYLVMFTNFILVFLIMYFSGRRIKKGLKAFFEEAGKTMPRLPNKSIALVVSAIESIYVGIKFTPNIILLISNTSFGEVDPIFNLDVSFYMFVEPIIKMLCTYTIFIFIAIIVYSFLYYIIVFNKCLDEIDRKTLKNSPLMKTIYRNIRAIAIVLAIYILVCSMDIVFDNFLTTDNNIRLAGAGIVDSTVKYWGYNILGILILISVFRAIKYFKKGEQSGILKSIAIIPIYLCLLFVVMILFDFIIVHPNEFDKEKIYIEKNISSTKKAYGIDCENENLEYTGTITVDEVKSNQEVIDNTVIVDKQIVLQSLEETQKKAGYYTYKTAGLANYRINGANNLVYVAPREIINNKRTFNSKTFEYTHGYGVIFVNSTEYEENGKIKYFQNDIKGENEEIKIKTPQIYYGLETNGPVITNAKGKREFDYADGEKEYETNYNGESGLSLNFIDRLILGLKEKNINLAITSSFSQNSKVLINRNIKARAHMALPDVLYDENLYTVIDAEGNINWVIDAYTVSSNYPYSTYTTIQYGGQRRDINYIRNSIKVIINSYTGEMKFYITDRTDPIAMAYRKVYPELFQDLDESIPDSIQEKFIYPEFLYKVQATMLEEYHNTKADVLYRSDDTWERATYKNTGTNSKNVNTLNAYYTTVKKDNETTIGLVQMYTPKNKQNITSYLVGTVENGENKLMLNTLSSDSPILGPSLLDTQISQDENIKKQIESLTVTGAKITKKMIIVPIENTLLYIEPVYQTLVNEDNIPTLKKVIVASGNKVAIGDTLSLAVENLISQYAGNISTQTEEDVNSLIDLILKANNNLTDSLKGNNWELMGTDIRRLQELITNLEKQVKEQKEEKNLNEKEKQNENVTENVTENV